MGLLVILLVGLVIGGLAKALMPGPDPGGLLLTSLLGIAGSALAGLLGRSIGWYKSAWSGPGLVSSVLGATLILLAYRVLR